MHHQPLAAVNAFFASDEGASYLAAHHGEDAPAVSEALANVTQAIAAAGLATETQEIDVCQTPALLVLAVILTPEEVRQGFNECQTSADARYAGDLTRVEQQMAAATVRLDNISKNLDLVGVKETLTWTVPEEGLPWMSAHRFVLSVKGDKAPRTFVKEMELSEGAMADVVAGDFNMTYQNMLISAMSDLVR
ncbi:hypothetical protein [Serratia fonticola]|uniref:hypothetical protein n=1 Tax=Serratia fonticola TaxID=47917 RepID=UPI00093B940C|nr:hypothetical protein [Serratia fonticola]OKP23819.1 hypothetical protein BSQ40_24285 [Serratia fonticola]